MKKIISILILMLVASILFSCSEKPRYETNPDDIDADTDYSYNSGIEPTEFQDDAPISIDADNHLCTFNNNEISFSWKTDDWSYELKNGIPVLTQIHNGHQFSFAVFSYNKGMADSLPNYASEAVQDFFKDYEVYDNMTSTSVDNRFNDKGYICEKTGFSFLNYFDKESTERACIGVVYAITNTDYSAVISVYATGMNDDLNKLFEDNYAGNRDNGLITECAETIIDSFEFVKK